jgi:GT2 family glycosyltransferase
MHMDLSIIIVNWNSTECLLDCLASIEKTTRDIEYEIIVVDNASVDEPVHLISERFPSVQLIRSDLNLGFARANNLGSDFALGNHILFLNPDTLILGDSVSLMVRLMDADPRIGILGCRLLNPDLSLQTSAIQPFPTIFNQLLTLDWLKRRWPRLPMWGMRPLFSNESSSVHEAEVVSGACMMIKEDIFKRVGGFSSEYFLYAEEMDLCRKVTYSGWRVCRAGDSKVIHLGGQSTKKRGSTFSHVVMRESVFKLLQKFRGNAYAQAYRGALLLSATARLAILLPLRIVPLRLFDRERVLYAQEKWHRIASWCLALEKWSKELVSQSRTTDGSERN